MYAADIEPSMVDHLKVRAVAEQLTNVVRRRWAQAGFRLDTTHDFLPRQHFLIFR